MRACRLTRTDYIPCGKIGNRFRITLSPGSIQDYRVFEGRTFKRNRFEGWLVHNNIPWPRLDSGQLDLSDDAFRERSKALPVVAPLRELRHALSEMRLNDLAVGSDGRNRCSLLPFAASSSRNTPSNTRFIFGPAVWLRHLITPPPGHGLAYIDYSQQEIGVAAALSGDPALISAYSTGDCYLAFAKQAKAVPPDATKESHPAERELYKQCDLGVGYGMEENSLALRINRAGRRREAFATTPQGDLLHVLALE